MLEFARVLEVDLDDLDRRIGQQNRDRFARHAVGRVDGDLLWLHVGSKELENVISVFAPEILLLQGAGWIAFGVEQSRREVFDLLQAGIDANRNGSPAGDFEAVVLGGVVRCRHLDPTARTEVVDREVNLRRVDHPDIDHTDVGRADAFDEGLHQRLAVCPHIPTDTQRPSQPLPPIVALDQRGKKPRRRRPDLPGVLLVQLLVVNAPDIVGFEYLRIHRHSFDPAGSPPARTILPARVQPGALSIQSHIFPKPHYTAAASPVSTVQNLRSPMNRGAGRSLCFFMLICDRMWI